jgi:regulator of RNase E activity RraA
MPEVPGTPFRWPLPVRGGPYDRPAPDLLAGLKTVSTATACAILHHMGITRTAILGPTALQPGQRLVGPAVTLQFMPQREDIASGVEQEYIERHTALWEVLNTIQEGDVLTIQAYGSAQTGCLGEMLIRHFRNQGGAGIVIDGRIRDSPKVHQMGVPIWSTGTTPHYSSQTELFPWGYDVPLACGRVLVLPGDIIIADDDGAVVVPASVADEVIAQARDHEAWEAFSRERIAAGGSLSQYYPLTAETRREFDQWQRTGRGLGRS